MATNLFAPTVWSETLYKELDKQYIGVAHCTRDFEGEIKQCGDTVRIVGVGAINVSDYTKDTDISQPIGISETLRELKITQAKYFNFQIDDIDRAQNQPELMREAMHRAASALANEADKYVFQACKGGMISVNAQVGVDTIIDTIIKARTELYAYNVTDNTELYLEISPLIAEYLFKEKRDMIFDNNTIVENGCIGSIHGCKVYVSNNIPVETTDDYTYVHTCFMRTKRSVTFAEQLSEIEAYRPELRFADAVKGLHLYGAKAVYPGEIAKLNFTLPEEA